MEFVFEITPPNFVITDKGKFSIADLDQKEFDEYCAEFGKQLALNRERIIKLKKDGNYDDAYSEKAE